MGDDTNNIAIGQLVVEVKAMASQNHTDHAEMKASMRKDKEWAETRFGQLFDKSDSNNIEIATLKANLANQTDRVQTLEIKLDKSETTVTALETEVDNLVWFKRFLVSAFVGQLMMTILAAILIKVFS